MPDVTNTPNSWTDGYGTVHVGPPPNGFWIASDDRWYAPELHPDYVPQAVEPMAHETVEPMAHETDPPETAEPLSGPTEWEPASPLVASVGAFDAAPRWDPDATPVASVGAHDAVPTWEQPGSWEMGMAPQPSDDTAPPAAQPSTDTGRGTNRPLVAGVIGVLAVIGFAVTGYALLSGGGSRDGGVIAGQAPATTNPDSEAATGDAGTVIEDDASATDDDTATTDDTATDDAADADGDAGIENDTDVVDGSVQPIGGASNPADLAGIESCTRIDAENLEVSMVNVSDATASYLLTVAYLDADGARVGDDNVYVSSLRPNERSIERSYVFNDAGVGCEVIDVDRFDRNGTEGLGDISACTIRPPNAFGYIEADVVATNSGSSDVDYTIEVALVDGDNIRRGYGTAYIERTRVGETAPGEIYTTVAYDETYRCEVVAVTRFDSA